MFYKRKKVKFSGFDWEELAEFFDIPYYDDENYENEDKPLREFLSKVRDDLYVLDTYYKKTILQEYEVKEIKEIVKVCRLYLEAFIKSSKKWHDDWPLYEGMLKIEEDMIFMDYFTLLFNRMWT